MSTDQAAKIESENISSKNTTIIRQISQNYKTGHIRLENVHTPVLKRGGVLVKTDYSVISLGTESMKVREGKMSLIEKARARPDQVKKVIKTVQQQGVSATFNKVMNKLDSLTSLGYSLSGTIIAVGAEVDDLQVGQRVACAGAGYAVHAETVFVPKNLVVPVPDEVDLSHAAFATVGAIAMQGFRQGEMQLGETACVIGLGLLGQLLAQILKAAGMIVIGIDIDDSRNNLATELGVDYASKPDDSSLLQVVQRLTSSHGIDCSFITAGGNTNAPLELAVEIARDRGRIIDVGKTKLDLSWNDCYMKELDLRFSRSYGPGRYDTNYEEKGVDYPIGYVRWTERRNMESFIDLIARKQLNMAPIITSVHPFSDAEEVYQKIGDGKLVGIGVMFEHEPSVVREKNITSEQVKTPIPVEGKIGIGAIGAGNYASSMLFPALTKVSDAVFIEVATATGLSAKNAAHKFPFVRTSTDYKQMIQMDDVDAVIVATRHSSHAFMVEECLLANKSVFVEKPLSVDLNGLEKVRKVIVETGNDRLQVGFNRRFSPLIQKLKQEFEGVDQPLVMNFRVHAGQLDTDSWYLDSEEGSRFIGEAGHFLDVFSYLTGARPVDVFARALTPKNTTTDDRENMSVIITYDDGSVGNLQYLTQGSNKLPKEFLEVSGAGKSAQMDNFQTLIVYSGMKRNKHKSSSLDKGQGEQMRAFIESVKNGRAMPISVESLIDTTLVTLAADESAKSGRSISLMEYWGEVK